jgi:hypothetical protein
MGRGLVVINKSARGGQVYVTKPIFKNVREGDTKD